MTTYILEGGLGNLLFQFNYYIACQKVLNTVSHGNQVKLAIIDGFLRKLYFKLLPVNANRDIDVFHELTGASPDSVLNSTSLIGLGISKIANAPYLGFFHDKYSQLSVEASLAHKFVFTYGHNNVPISHDLIKELRKTLIHSEYAKHIRQNMKTESYDAVLHYRAGDTKTLSSLSKRYFSDACQIYSKVLVITNDLRKARSVFTSRNFFFLIQHQSLITDLIYMVNAKAFIGSNSTLSWWASEVSHNEQVINFPAYRSLSDSFNPASNKSRFFHEIA